MKYTDAELLHHYLADLLTDARTSLKYARAVERGGSGYGSTAEEYRQSAAKNKAKYRELKSAERVRITMYGTPVPF